MADRKPCRTPIIRRSRETLATLKLSVARRPKFHLQAEQLGTFSCLEACPCHQLHTVTPISIAVRCVDSVAAITSAVSPAEATVSAGSRAMAVLGAAIVSVAEVDTAIGKKID